MTAELDPCPFCGCRAPQFEHTDDGRHLAYVVCPRCELYSICVDGRGRVRLGGPAGKDVGT